jgi:hypothetical protein
VVIDKASRNYSKVPIVQRVSWLVKNVCLGREGRSDGVVQSKGKTEVGKIMYRGRDETGKWLGALGNQFIQSVGRKTADSPERSGSQPMGRFERKKTRTVM